MKAPAAALGVGAIIALATVIGFGSAVPPGFAADPSPSAVPLTVVIPGPSATATASPSPSPSSSGAGGNSGSGSSGTSGGSPQLPTEADGSLIPPSTPTKGAFALTLDHETITANEWMVAVGTGYTPGEKVQFVLYPGVIVIGSFVADTSGTVTARFKITENARPGYYVVEATGWQSFRVANAEFQIVAPSTAGAIPFLWWVLIVLGVILIGLVSAAIYFRRSIRVWFGGAIPAAGTQP